VISVQWIKVCAFKQHITSTRHFVSDFKQAILNLYRNILTKPETFSPSPQNPANRT